MATARMTTLLVCMLFMKDIYGRSSLLRKQVSECPYPLPCHCYEDYDGKPDFIVDCSRVKFNSENITDFDSSWSRVIDQLDLNSNNLFHLHSHSFKGLHVVEIYMHDSNIRNISVDSFTGASRLRSLVLYGNSLDTSAFRAFRKLNELVKLDLSMSNTPYNMLPSDAFTGMDSLEELDLADCGIDIIDPGAFSGLKSLKILKLNGNHKLQDIPLAVQSIKTLEELEMRVTGMSILPSGRFKYLSHLKILHLNTNNLSAESISDDAFSGVENSLEYLDLADNQLGKVPTFALRILSNLKTLKLSNNRIASIEPNAFSGLVHLERLYLDHNDDGILTIKTKAFHGLGSSLKYLALDYDGLSEIPTESLSHLKNLESLLLNDNNIVDVPRKAFEVQKNLKVLDLSRNNLTLASFKDKSFVGLGNLQVLEMKGNSISVVPSHSFIPLKNLKKLDIARNKMKALQPAAFQDLTKLESLDIGRNPISFHKESFAGLERNLHYLSIRGAGLPKLHLESLVSLKGLETLDISYNYLEKISKSTFAGLQTKSVILIRNEISSVDKDTFDDLPTPLDVNLQENRLKDLSFVRDPCRFKQLLVDRNPLTCGCHEYQLSKYQGVRLNASIPIFTQRISATCIRPYELYQTGMRSEKFHSVSVSRCPGVSETPKLCPVSSAVVSSGNIQLFVMAYVSIMTWLGVN